MRYSREKRKRVIRAINFSLFFCRYYVLCKRAEGRVKNLNHLLKEWKRMEDFLAPDEVQDWDDYTPKQMLIFLKTYALYFG